MSRYGGGGGFRGNIGDDRTNTYSSAGDRGWNYGSGYWRGTGGGYTSAPAVQPPSSGSPPARPPSTAQAAHTSDTGNPGPGRQGSPTGGPQPNPAQPSSGPGVESPNSALNALGGTANVPSGSADRFNSSNPSRTVTGSSTGTPSPGAQTFDPTSTASDNTFPGPASGASKGPPLAGILVGVFVGLLLVLAIIAGVILVRRRRRRAERNGEQLISEEDDRASEPRPYMLPAPPSPSYARPPRAHGLTLDSPMLQDCDVEGSPMSQTQIYSPIMSPTFTRDSKPRQNYWPGHHFSDSNPTTATTLTWVQDPSMDHDGSIISSSDPDVDPDHPSSEALQYADPPPAYQTGSAPAPLADVKTALG